MKFIEALENIRSALDSESTALQENRMQWFVVQVKDLLELMEYVEELEEFLEYYDYWDIFNEWKHCNETP